MMRASFAAFVTGAVFALAGAVHADPAPDQNGEELLHAADRVEWEAGGLYDGRFSDGTPFQIEIAYPEPESVPARVRGAFATAYWYPRGFDGKMLPTRAGVGPVGTLAVNVMASDGRTHDETFVFTLARGGMTGQGTWTSDKLGKTLGFTLKRSVVYHAVAVERAPPPGMLAGDTRQFTYSAVFPVLVDPTVNAWVRDVLRACDGDAECTNAVKVTWNGGGLLSLESSVWGAYREAPHGNGRVQTRHYRTGGDRLAQAPLEHFLDASPTCHAKVSKVIIDKLRVKGLSGAEYGALDSPVEANFAPLPEGLRFSWNQNGVGTYADGRPSVFLTRAELGDCVKNLPRWE